MKSRSIRPNTHTGMRDAAIALDITIHKLDYLCKTGRVAFITSEKGTRWFDIATLDILPKPESTNPKDSNTPIGFVTVSECAKNLRLSIQKIYRLIKSGKLDVYRPSNSKRIYINPENLEIDGKPAYNVAPQISAPQPITEIFQQVESESTVLTNAFHTIKQFMSSMADNSDNGDEEDTIEYVKNMLMYRIQNLEVF